MFGACVLCPRSTKGGIVLTSLLLERTIRIFFVLSLWSIAVGFYEVLHDVDATNTLASMPCVRWAPTLWRSPLTRPPLCFSSASLQARVPAACLPFLRQTSSPGALLLRISLHLQFLSPPPPSLLKCTSSCLGDGVGTDRLVVPPGPRSGACQRRVRGQVKPSRQVQALRGPATAAHQLRHGYEGEFFCSRSGREGGCSWGAFSGGSLKPG